LYVTPKFTQKWDFWFENIPSGNPAFRPNSLHASQHNRHWRYAATICPVIPVHNQASHISYTSDFKKLLTDYVLDIYETVRSMELKFDAKVIFLLYQSVAL
jgi:hypothetical protein